MASYLSFNNLKERVISLKSLLQWREFFQKWTNQKQELPVVAMFVNGSGWNKQSL
jgi:hypothetical protein